jgi:hypothetical protein
MTPAKQLNKHDPANGVYGDCGRTCIAMLLDRDPASVPHFWDGGDETSNPGQWDRMQAWLLTQGYAMVAIPFPGEASLQEVLTSFGSNNPDVYYMLTGRSPRADHSVICLNDEIVADPSWSNNGLVGPNSGGYWYVELLIPSILKRRRD